ncbi:MAG: hypothetical protein M0Z45_02590 [Actinomycetota bacterium]|nr:hypothetical protein [Actinomycetota bacterium]
MANSKLTLGRKINLAMALAVVGALGVSAVLVEQLVSNVQSANLSRVRIQSQATATTDAQASESQSFTKVDSGSEKLVKGVTVLSIAGHTTRVSRVDDFNFDWTGVWSADCQDAAASSVFKIDLISISNTGVKSTVAVDKTVDSGGFVSGTFDGVATPIAQFKVESSCDWSLSVVKVS